MHEALFVNMDTTADVRNQARRAADGGGTARTETAMPPMLLTIPEAARVLAVGRTTMYELIAAGAVEVVHIGRSARVPIAALEAFVERMRSGTVTVSSPTASPAAGRRRAAPGRRVPQRGDQGRLFGGARQQT